MPRSIDVTEHLVEVDQPAEGVTRLTLNRPEQRNALNHALRGGIIAALRAAGTVL